VGGVARAALLCAAFAALSLDAAEGTVGEGSEPNIKTIQKEMEDIFWNAESSFTHVTSKTLKEVQGNSVAAEAQLSELADAQSALNTSVEFITKLSSELETALVSAKEAASAETDDQESSAPTVDLKPLLKASQSIRAEIIDLSEAGGNACEDDDEELRNVYRGRYRSCQEAHREFKNQEISCSDDMGKGPLSDLCPVSCGTCTPPGDLLGQIELVRIRVAEAKTALNKAKSKYGGAGLMNNAQANLKKVIKEVKERFNNGTLMTPLLDSFKTMQDSMKKLIQ